MFTADHREVIEKYIPREIASRIADFAMSHLSRWMHTHGISLPSEDEYEMDDKSESDTWEREFDDMSIDLYST